MQSSLSTRFVDPLARRLHDLNNMLLVVLAHADLARETLSSDHPSFRHIERAKSAAQNATAIIQDLAPTAGSAPAHNDSLRSQPAPARSPRLEAFLQSGPAKKDARLTILIVEDEAIIRESSLEFLSRAGFDVLEAGSAEEALEVLESHRGAIDLLITDVALPRMTGTELAKRAASSFPAIKILAISGHPEQWVLDLPDTPIKQFLAKPFSFSDLHAKVCELFSEKRPVRGVGAI